MYISYSSIGKQSWWIVAAHWPDISPAKGKTNGAQSDALLHSVIYKNIKSNTFYLALNVKETVSKYVLLHFLLRTFYESGPCL